MSIIINLCCNDEISSFSTTKKNNLSYGFPPSLFLPLWLPSQFRNPDNFPREKNGITYTPDYTICRILVITQNSKDLRAVTTRQLPILDADVYICMLVLAFE